MPTPAPSQPDQWPADPERATQVLRQFRVVFNAVRTHFQQVEKRVGLGGAQVWALHVIQNQAGLGVNELARAMDIHQSTASNLVRQLLKRELVRSETSPLDRRGVRLFVLPAGAALLADVPGPYEGVLPDALRQLSGPRLERLQQDLDALIQILQADESAGGIPLAEL